MFKNSFFSIVLLLFPFVFYAQSQAIVQEGEFGLGFGAGQYFGDLNTRSRVNTPKIAATAFFRKNFGNYIAVRVGASMVQLGYSDIYNTHNAFMNQRNLSFNATVWELTLQGDFNFFRFVPGEPGYNFTPYITFGVGAFNYDPYAMLSGKKYFLRTLNTEGQGNALYPDRQPYKSTTYCIPFGVGMKYSINERINIGVELLHRFTGTDYLDDVSKTFVDPSIFLDPAGVLPPTPAYYLYDRSYELGEPIGSIGRQRGISTQKDQFVTGVFYMTFNLQSYKCPTAR